MLVEIDGVAPTVDGQAWVAPTAAVIGRVSVAAHASLWFGTVARGDGDAITIGEGTNLQDGVVVHADPGFPARIGARVSVGHSAIVHGCTVEDDVLIGMGATVMNGSVIGSESIIAAGALLPEGTVVPPRSLVVGAPGRVRRELTEDEVATVHRNARVYRDRSAAYAASARVLDGQR